MEMPTIKYVIKSQSELNLSYMPFIIDGGLFIPTSQTFNIDDEVKLEIQLPAQTNLIMVEAKVIWITPKNALYHVYQGVGVQFKGVNAKAVRDEIVSHLDSSLDVGGYTSGILPK